MLSNMHTVSSSSLVRLPLTSRYTAGPRPLKFTFTGRLIYGAPPSSSLFALIFTFQPTPYSFVSFNKASAISWFGIIKWKFLSPFLLYWSFLPEKFLNLILASLISKVPLGPKFNSIILISFYVVKYRVYYASYNSFLMIVQIVIESKAS